MTIERLLGVAIMLVGAAIALHSIFSPGLQGWQAFIGGLIIGTGHAVYRGYRDD